MCTADLSRHSIFVEASCMQVAGGPPVFCTALHVSSPLSTALMPADGTVKDSYVKQSADGGKVDVDNGGATCIAPVTVCTPALCLEQIGAMNVSPLLGCRSC